MDKVICAELHDGFFIPGMGQVGGQFTKSLPPNGKTLKNFSMVKETDGSLTLSWQEGNFLKRVSVGAATVKVAVLEPLPLGKLETVEKVKVVK